MHWILVVIVLFLPGCSTVTYNSKRPPQEVADCISMRWTNSPSSGYKAPISNEKQEQGYFVAFALGRPFFSPIIFGNKHPLYPVWAEVKESPSGSTTEYHRAFQIWHKNIDRAVEECQEESRNTCKRPPGGR